MNGYPRYDPPEPPVDGEGVRRPLSEVEFQAYLDHRLRRMYAQVMHALTLDDDTPGRRRWPTRGGSTVPAQRRQEPEPDPFGPAEPQQQASLDDDIPF